MNRIATLLTLVTIVGLTLGCGGPEGPKRYRVSGSIAMPNGKPVPAGEINFEPDGQAGNSGPASMVQIKDGKYSLPLEQGILGGKYIVTIMPYDGVAFGESVQGKPLTKTPHVEKVDLPTQDSTKDFTVTAK